MKELQDYWDVFVRRSREWWAKSLGVVVFAVSAFFAGVQYEQKQITDDCKFMGSFREGTQAYNCQMRAR